MASGARHRPPQSRGFSAFNHQAPVSEPCKDLLRSILQPTPEKRATPAQILAHEWVAGGAAPLEQLQHAVEGIRHLRLRARQPDRRRGYLGLYLCASECEKLAFPYWW